ncbi:MAG: pyridoxamine 5'-phosphate oxidase [Proteobacteria bacterium]|nr:pyridoxamine 5'-phosphate oxidase [Pseudomonadota bacterium]
MSIIEEAIATFATWFKEAKASPIIDPSAMALATVSADSMPSVRIVLMKNFDQQGLVFYTNTTSDKARDIKAHPHASACFHWDTLKKQVRVSGRVESVTSAEADAYFASRPRESQLGAWASLQSQPMASRAEFEARLLEFTKKFEGQAVPRPAHWSGFRIVPNRIEFWIDRPYRLHERWVYTRADEQKAWQKQLLYP